MPRNMSFSLTTDQVRARTKTVTRRTGWATLKPGTILWACVKCQGIPKGGKVERITQIRVTKVNLEYVGDIDDAEVALEGFPDKNAAWFVEMFTRHNGGSASDTITRIEFEYVDSNPEPPTPERYDKMTKKAAPAEPNYYEVLGIPLRGKADDPAFNDWPEYAEIRDHWRTKVAAEHPANHPESESDTQHNRFCAVMEAGLTLLDPSDMRAYQACLAKGDKWKGVEYNPDDLDDWLVLIVDDLIKDAVAAREDIDDPTSAGALAAAKSFETPYVPEFIPGPRLAGIEGLDAGAFIAGVIEKFGDDLTELQKFARKHPNAITWKFRTKPCWRARGNEVVMVPKKLNKERRADRAGADNQKPHGEIVMSLQWWMVATDKERSREVFRALLLMLVENDQLRMRAPRSAPNPAEVREFGLEDAVDAEFVAEALRHPATLELLEDKGVLTGEQLGLFAGFSKAIAETDA